MPLLGVHPSGDPRGATVVATDLWRTRPDDGSGSAFSVGFSDEPRRARIREVEMSRFEPLLTVALLGGALFTLNVVNSPANSTGTPSAAAAPQPAVVAAPPPAAPPATSAPPAAAA